MQSPEPTAAAHPYALLLLIAALLEAIFMAMHPTAHAQSIPDLVVEIAQGATYNRAIHGTLMLLSLAIFLGLHGLTDILGPRNLLVRAGLIAYAAGFIALLGAAITNGFVLPGIIPANAATLIAGDPALAERLRPLMALIRVANESLAQAGVIAISLAVILWSTHMLRAVPAFKLIGASGLIISLLITTALLAGYLPMNFHGFGAFILLQTLWNIAVAIRMLKVPSA